MTGEPVAGESRPSGTDGGSETRERRQGNRLRSLLGAEIRIAPHASDTACLIRDCGPDGLRLALSDGVPLPEIFDLHIRKTRQMRPVRLIWRGDECVGVQFVPGDHDVDVLEDREEEQAALRTSYEPAPELSYRESSLLCKKSAPAS